MPWPPQSNWNTPTGEALKALAFAGAPSSEFNRLILFGSGALQLTVAPELLSADVDISLDIVPTGTPMLSSVQAEQYLRTLVAKVNQEFRPGTPYLQVCHWMTFQPAHRWERRLHEESVEGWRIVVPHPYDILFSKLRRLEQKDIEAFKTVIARTDHPTEKEFLLICRENFRDFEPRRLESTNHIPRPTAKHDIRETTTRLWRKIWFKEIDIDREITGPVYEEIDRNWNDYDSSLKDELSGLNPPEEDEGQGIRG